MSYTTQPHKIRMSQADYAKVGQVLDRLVRAHAVLDFDVIFSEVGSEVQVQDWRDVRCAMHDLTKRGALARTSDPTVEQYTTNATRL